MSTWATRVRDLQEVGMTLSEIGDEIGMATSSVGDIANGRSASPRGDAALKLHALHQLKCSPLPRSGHAAA